MTAIIPIGQYVSSLNVILYRNFIFRNMKNEQDF